MVFRSPPSCVCDDSTDRLRNQHKHDDCAAVAAANRAADIELSLHYDVSPIVGFLSLHSTPAAVAVARVA